MVTDYSISTGPVIPPLGIVNLLYIESGITLVGRPELEYVKHERSPFVTENSGKSKVTFETSESAKNAKHFILLEISF